MKELVATIDLPDHFRPEEVLEKLKKKYPDPNVELTFFGGKIIVKASPRIPLQLQINIGSFLRKKVQEEVFSSKQKGLSL